MNRSWLLALGFIGTLIWTAAAQEGSKGKKSDAAPVKEVATEASNDTPAAADEQPSDAAKIDDPAVAEFDKVFAEWKELLGKLQDLRLRYVATPRKGNQRQPLKKEYDELIKEGDALEPKVLQAAEAAFAVTGNKRPEIGKFLATHLKYDVEHDDYEPAVPIARALIDNGYDNARVYNYGGMAAFCTNDFDTAQKWLEEADKNSVLDVDGKQFLEHLAEYSELWDAEEKLREAEAKADDLPRVLMKTSKGDLVLELFENEAPNTVANFVSLVEKGFYNGVKFHRVLEHFMAQGGDPEGTGNGGPGYSIPDETDNPDYRKHFRGSLSMAKTNQPDTGGSQFFLMFRPSGPAAGYDLNGKHTVFGRVIDGMEVLSRIQRINPEDPKPGDKPDKIVEATVIRKRKHEYVPKKVGDESAAKDESNKE
jgi:cyclophilin family peptidyl-prolyl cis-trans isomerase